MIGSRISPRSGPANSTRAMGTPCTSDFLVPQNTMTISADSNFKRPVAREQPRLGVGADRGWAVRPGEPSRQRGSRRVVRNEFPGRIA